MLHSVVLNPLPYEDPERLVIVWETASDNPERWVAPANFVDWRRESRSFASLAAFDEFSPTLAGRGEPERLRALGASGTFFTTLGATAAIGRTLLPSDDEPDATGVAVLSDGLWDAPVRRSAGCAWADAAARRPQLHDRRRHAARVSSRRCPAGIDVWLSGDRGVPRTFPFGGDLTAVRDSHIIFVVGRLAPGATREVAQQELSAMMAGARAALPATPTPASASTSSRSTKRSSATSRSSGAAAAGGRHDAAHRVRQRRAPAARSGGGPAGRDDDARRAGRGARAARPADAGRDAGDRGSWRRAGAVAGRLGTRRARRRWRRADCRALQEIGIDPIVLAFTIGVTLLTAGVVRPRAGVPAGAARRARADATRPSD